MASRNLRFEAIDFGPARLIGKPVTVSQGKTAAKHVRAFRADGSFALLNALPGRISPEGDLVIWMGEYDPETKTFVDIPGVLATPDCPVPEGFVSRELPRCLMGVGWISGPTRELTRGAHNKTVQLMKQAGCAPDYSLGFSMEYYSREGYEADRPEGENYTFGYYLPCGRVQ